MCSSIPDPKDVSFSTRPSYSSNNTANQDDPALTALVDAAWEAELAYQTNPSQANIMSLMDRVNQINAYFKDKGYVDPKDGSHASKLYEALNDPPQYPSTETIAQMCAHYPEDSAAVSSIVAGLQSSAGKSILLPLFAAINSFGSITNDKSKANIKQDIDYLKQDLDEYNRLMAEKNPDPKIVQALLARIAELCPQLEKDCKDAGVTDGYLTGILTLLNTPISTDSGSPSLMALASASPPDLDKIQEALKALGEAGKGGDLTSFLNTTEKYEYGN